MRLCVCCNVVISSMHTIKDQVQGSISREVDGIEGFY